MKLSDDLTKHEKESHKPFNSDVAPPPMPKAPSMPQVPNFGEEDAEESDDETDDEAETDDETDDDDDDSDDAADPEDESEDNNDLAEQIFDKSMAGDLREMML